MGAIVVITTVGTQDQANLLAEELVDRHHSCCVNIVRIARSVYRWQGRICDDSEYMLIIKSMDYEYPKIEAAIQELHSYDLPEILCFDVTRGEAGFLAWIAGCLERGKEADEGEGSEPSAAPDSDKGD